MLRVHEGVPVLDLPMVLPAPAQVIFQGDVNGVAPMGQVNAPQAPSPSRPTNIIDQVLQDIFGSIGGGGGSGGGGSNTGSDR
jgi:hypothetical protein